MKYFTELMDHIASFLKDLVAKFQDVLRFFDNTKNNLDDAKEIADSVESD